MDETQVKVTVNGKQAEQELQRLRERADSLKKSLEDAYRAGNGEAAKHFKRELGKTTAELRKMESGTEAVRRTMLQLNKATPADLNRALKFLTQELKNIERGSDAWNAQVAKIKQVKAELEKVNAEMKVSKSLFERMKDKINDWGAMAAGGAAAMTGLVMAGKKAVQSYAEMEQEMANVRKYTGMTAEEVEHLNEAFKKMDTRTSREGLNQLAQEAGRLGMQSEEDVLGFVKAADKINVALDDLGEGATLTLSKLTDIFGDKQRLGVEQSLLSVGSVINELSQNSTASAPYLAEFAQRLAGVGAQAQMSIPEIMGFGAVLDSQGQKLEMSATALSKVIMNLFKDPAKIAQATGLSIEQFSETCKRSTNEGLLMLLDRLHELGGIDALAPVFKDMGENGARASAVLAALAGNVDMVRQQQEAANVAFNEAVSIDKEFNVQNETVQAGLEKARKRFNEMAVELGQKLMPVMKYFHSGLSYTMKLLSKTIDFVKKYNFAIAGAAAGVAAYYVVLKAKEAWDTFVGGCKKAIEAVKAFNKALMANPIAAIIGLVVALGVALAGFIKRQNEAARAADEHRKALERQREAEKRTADAVGEVIGKYQKLKTEWENLSSAQAKKDWLDKNRDAFEELGLNINSVIDADKVFVEGSEKVIAALKARAKARALEGLYEEKMRQVYNDAAEMEDENMRFKPGVVDVTANDLTIKYAKAAGLRDENGNWTEGLTKESSRYGEDYVSKTRVLTEKGAEVMNAFLDQLHQQAIDDAVKIGEQSVESVFGSWMVAAQTEAQKAEAETNGLVGSGTKGSKTILPLGEESLSDKELKKQHDEALKEVEDWKKKENAINQIAYLQGEKDHCDYTERSKEIDVEYWQKRMTVEKEGSAEYLDAQAKMLEAKKKQDEFYTKGTIEEEQRGYTELKATIDQNYADGKMSAKAYQLALEAAELDHLKAMVELYDEGSDERLKAQEKYQARSLQYQRKHADDAKRIQEQLQKDYFSNVSGVTNSEGYAEERMQLEVVRELMLAQATADQKLQIEEAYQQARYELAKKYHDEEGMYAVDSAQAWSDKVAEFLQSEGAQKFQKAFSTMVNGMGQIFSGLTSLIDAETDLQTAQIEKRYQKEIDAAGNNKDLVAKLEAEKEAEIAKVKNEAEEKKYGMEIASAIAQTAVAAINAYSSAAAIPIVGGLTLGPIAAAMAVAAGAIQIAAIKKQHEAAMAQGYAAGGYTAPGGKYQPAGIVHAGEWVASQELLANPTAAATIAQLDQAQRTNTIGQLSKPSPALTSSNVDASTGQGSSLQRDDAPGVNIGESIDRLNRTLDNGIYAATTMTGDKGIQRQQRKYDQLMRNKGKK